jgi:hypothetical protein
MNCKIQNCKNNCKTQKWASKINFVTIVITNARFDNTCKSIILFTMARNILCCDSKKFKCMTKAWARQKKHVGS